MPQLFVRPYERVETAVVRDMSLKTIPTIIVLTLFLLATSNPCLALRGIFTVTKESAEKDFGAKIRSQLVATNVVGVWLEFAPKGKLEKFHHVELEITLRGQRIVGAVLQPLNQSEERVIVYFSTAPAYLTLSTLTVIVPVDPLYAECYQFRMKDFLTHG
jgi:hypothetical protein